jgi:raffinose/stachyose/melibiose transport system substrate-binding protein
VKKYASNCSRVSPPNPFHAPPLTLALPPMKRCLFAFVLSLAFLGKAFAEPKELTFWITDFNQQQFADFNKIVVEGFNRSQSDYAVKASLIQQYDRELKLALSAGKGPDILFTEGPSYLVQYGKNGLVIPLDNYATKYGWDKKFITSTLNLERLNEKLYGLPDEYESMFLYYNKTLFEKNGWTPPKNAEEFQRIVDEAKAKGITPLAGGNANWKGTNEWFITVVLNHYAGAENVYQALTGKLPWNAPVFVEAINLLNDWWQKGYFSKNYYALSNTEAINEVATGKAAMTFSGSWAIHDMTQTFSQSGQEWDWAPIPSFASSATYPLYELGIGGTQSISKFCKNPDGAAAFLDFMYQPKVFMAWTEAQPSSGQLLPPGNFSEQETTSSKLDPRLVKQNAEVLNCIRTGQIGYTTWAFWPDRTEQLMINEIEKVWSGQIKVADYLKQVNDQFQQDVKDGRLPPVIAPGGKE